MEYSPLPRLPNTCLPVCFKLPIFVHPLFVSRGTDLIIIIVFGAVMRLQFMQFSPSSFSFTSHTAQFPDHTSHRPQFPHHTVLDTLNLCPSLNVRSGFKPIVVKRQKQYYVGHLSPYDFVQTTVATLVDQRISNYRISNTHNTPLTQIHIK